MARYLFQTQYRGVTITDDIGEEFSTVQEAEAYADIIAKELARNSGREVTVRVIGADGALLGQAAAGAGSGA